LDGATTRGVTGGVARGGGGADLGRHALTTGDAQLAGPVCASSSGDTSAPLTLALLATGATPARFALAAAASHTDSIWRKYVAIHVTARSVPPSVAY
jgi:hypothetical protein